MKMQKKQKNIKKKLKLVFVSEQITLEVGTNEWHKAKENEQFFIKQQNYLLLF